MYVPESAKDRKRMVEQAVLAKAPKLHARLKASGELEAVLEERAALMYEVRDTLSDTAAERAATSGDDLPWMERISRHQQEDNAAAEVAIAQATEFPIE